LAELHCALYLAQLILPPLLLIFRLVGFLGDPGYIEVFQEVVADQRIDLTVQFAFTVLSAVLPFVLWTVLCKKFFARKSGFADSFLKCILLAWAVALGIDVLRALILEDSPNISGYGGLIFGLGLAQWLLHSPRVKAVFVR
jgi:hypothetical protein